LECRLTMRQNKIENEMMASGELAEIGVIPNKDKRDVLLPIVIVE